MIRWLASSLALAAACASPPPPVPAPAPPQPAAGEQSDAGPNIEELRTAAFVKVMEDTAPLREHCWAVGAADDFHLAGRVVLSITLGGKGAPKKVEATEDSTGDADLVRCLVHGYEVHAWPPVFDDPTTIKVPLQFDAPSGQYTIDPAMITAESNGAPPATMVYRRLMRPQNTGNSAASMTLMELSGGFDLGLHVTPDGAQVFFVAAGQGIAYDYRGVKRGHPLVAGSLVVVPANAVYDIAQTGGETLQLVRVIAPAAVRILDPPVKLKRNTPHLTVLDTAKLEAISIAGGKGWVKLPASAKASGGAIYAGVIGMVPGAKVPPHSHSKETELLYIYKGSGTMTVGKRQFPIEAPIAVQVPPGLQHSFTAATDVEAVQFYTPSGPEQRFVPAPQK